MRLAVGNVDERWDIAAQIKQGVHFDRGLVLAEPRPREQAQA